MLSSNVCWILHGKFNLLFLCRLCKTTVQTRSFFSYLFKINKGLLALIKPHSIKANDCSTLSDQALDFDMKPCPFNISFGAQLLSPSADLQPFTPYFCTVRLYPSKKQKRLIPPRRQLSKPPCPFDRLEGKGMVRVLGDG